MSKTIQTISFDEATREILRYEAMDAAIAVGRCLFTCAVSVDEIVDNRTSIRHGQDAFPVTIDDAARQWYPWRQRDVIGPYAHWAKQFHPAPEAWMT